MKKLSLVAFGAVVLAVAGLSPAFAGSTYSRSNETERDRSHVSIGIFLGAPAAYDRGYDDDGYRAHRRWEERRRWEAHQRWLEQQRCKREREHARYDRDGDDWRGDRY